MVALCVGPSVPSMHGYAVVQAPLLDMNTSPGGVGSVTTTLAAADGPKFFTTTVNPAVSPAVAPAGPVFVIVTSAMGVIVVVSVAVLFSGAGSGVSAGEVTVAVFVSVPVAVAATVPVAVNVTVSPAGRLA